MANRAAPAGVGTYVVYDSLARTDKWDAFQAQVALVIDLVFGTSVSEHVLGGYKFLTRYWAPGDNVYIFGFSRGAYTARFLAEMLDHVGLLPHGNEELVGFAWRLFAEWQKRNWAAPKQTSAFWKKYFESSSAAREKGKSTEQGAGAVGTQESKSDGPVAAALAATDATMPASQGQDIGPAPAIAAAATATQDGKSAGRASAGATQANSDVFETPTPTSPESYNFFEYLTFKPRRDERNRAKAQALYTKLEGFKRMFSRDVGRIRFLGLFDTVSSVPQFDVSWMTRGGRFAYAPRSKADEVWHAVSIEERRVYFRANLMYQPPPNMRTAEDDDRAHENPDQVLHEVWFSGNHGDVGGGWAPTQEGVPTASYIPLVWMVRAAKKAGVKFSAEGLAHEGIILEEDGAPLLNVSADRIVGATDQQALDHGGTVVAHGIVLDDLHDCLTWGKGPRWSAWGWDIAQLFPVKIMEYFDNGWRPTRWRRKRWRTIPRHPKTRIHASVFHRMQHDKTYQPPNLPGDGELRVPKWWQHGPLALPDNLGFRFDDWEVAPELGGSDYISLAYRIRPDRLATMPEV